MVVGPLEKATNRKALLRFRRMGGPRDEDGCEDATGVCFKETGMMLVCWSGLEQLNSSTDTHQPSPASWGRHAPSRIIQTLPSRGKLSRLSGREAQVAHAAGVDTPSQMPAGWLAGSAGKGCHHCSMQADGTGTPLHIPCCAFIASNWIRMLLISQLGIGGTRLGAVLPMFVTQSPAPPPEDGWHFWPASTSESDGMGNKHFFLARCAAGRTTHPQDTPTFAPIETSNSAKWAAKRAGDTMHR